MLALVSSIAGYVIFLCLQYMQNACNIQGADELEHSPFPPALSHRRPQAIMVNSGWEVPQLTTTGDATQAAAEPSAVAPVGSAAPSLDHAAAAATASAARAVDAAGTTSDGTQLGQLGMEEAGGAASSSGGGAPSVAAPPHDPLAVLRRLPLPRLCPVGYLFLWVPKTLVSQVVRLLYSWGYVYIENLTWVWMNPNNRILRLPAPYAASSHATLYIFRKDGEGRDIELRHQRNPDVVFDCVQATPGAFKIRVYLYDV